MTRKPFDLSKLEHLWELRRDAGDSPETGAVEGAARRERRAEVESSDPIAAKKKGPAAEGGSHWDSVAERAGETQQDHWADGSKGEAPPAVGHAWDEYRTALVVDAGPDVVNLGALCTDLLERLEAQCRTRKVRDRLGDEARRAAVDGLMRLIRLSVEHEVQAWVGRHTDTETQPHTDDPEAETSGASGTGSWIEVDAPKQFTDATNDLEGLLEVYLLR